MAGVLQHLRSSTLNKRPNPASMVDGQLAINYASGSPGAFFKDTNGNLVKVGPVHVGTTAPNVSPASGGTAGNSLGEQWLDTSGGTYVFKIWDGAAWRSEAGEFVNSTGDTMTGSLTMGPSANLIFEGSTDDGFETTLTVVDPTADRTITLPNVSGTVVTTGDSGTVTSTMIADGTIVNADVNASAAIAGTKISPDFGSQTIQTTGVFSHAVGSAGAPIITFTGDTNTGIYSPGADQVAISTGGSGRLFVDASGRVGIGASGPGFPLEVRATSSTGQVQILGSDNTNATWRLATPSSNVVAFGGALTHAVAFGGFDNTTQAFSERSRIDSSGRLLVGTSSSRQISGNTAQIQLEGTDTNNSAFSITTNSNNNQCGYLVFGKSRGTAIGGTTVVQTDDFLGRIDFAGANGSNVTNIAALIAAQVDGTVSGGGANDMPGRLVFSTTSDGASSPTPRMTIKSNGNVGIGTTSPGAIVHSTVSSAGVVFRGSHNNSGIDLYANDATGEARITATRLGGSGGKFLSFYTDTGTGEFERSRIDSSGRLLVGTSSNRTSGALQVEGTTYSTSLLSVFRNSADASPPYFQLMKSRGSSVGSNTAVVSGDVLGVVSFIGTDGASTLNAAQIEAVVDGTPGTNDMPGRLVFSTTADGASSPTERMRINRNGLIQAQGIYDITTATAANVNVGTSGELQRSTSSIKYKTNVETLEDQYADALLGCRPVWYQSTCEADNPEWGHWGFIAEEVAAIDPRLCFFKEEEDGTLEPEGVQYDRFVPHLLNLIKRQQQAIETLETKVAALESA